MGDFCCHFPCCPTYSFLQSAMLLTIFSNNSLCLKFAFFAQNMFFLVQCWKQLLYCLSSFVSSTSSSSFSTLSCVLEDHINHYYMIKAPSSKGFMFLPSLFLPCRWALLTGQHQKGGFFLFVFCLVLFCFFLSTRSWPHAVACGSGALAPPDPTPVGMARH